jgi:hypothetical protein
MKAIKFLGRSVVSLYLVCLCLAVVSYPASADKCVGAGCDVASQVAAAQPSTATADQAPDVIAPVAEKSIVDKVMDKIPEAIKLGGLITMIFSAIAAATPSPKDDGVLLIIRKVIDLLAFNVGNAKSDAETKRKYAIR